MLLRRVSVSAVLASTGRRHAAVFSPRYDWRTSGVHDIAPRDEGDFVYEGAGHVLPGAHPLPLYHPHNTITRPVASPYLPSPQRPHPYFTAPLPELPHLGATKPIVYTYGTMKERIIVPVFNLKNEVTHTRELDPFIFGAYPEVEELSKNLTYWMVRCQNFASKWDYETREIWRKAKKNWPNTGMGMPRVSNRKNHEYPWGGRTKPSKPWNMLMPTMDIKTWSRSNRMMLCLKMLQGKLQVVERLTLPEPTQECYLDLCRAMSWGNAYDALKHDRLVITEGALAQLEEEVYEHKLMILPPHIRNQLPERGYLKSEELGDCAPVLRTIQMEAAARVEEVESSMYDSFVDNPYRPWKIDMEAAYAVDAADGTVQQYVDGKKTSWSMLS
uniref:Ribosomal protein L4/L1 family n=1 Tax=Trypanosoma vivax (strain Y486) TaxID=1055687 RepID=G0UBF7_TRYVY|nr:conserved hypothetical protein, fragment [Trypanosoma vivax Y486]